MVSLLLSRGIILATGAYTFTIWIFSSANMHICITLYLRLGISIIMFCI